MAEGVRFAPEAAQPRSARRTMCARWSGARCGGEVPAEETGFHRQLGRMNGAPGVAGRSTQSLSALGRVIGMAAVSYASGVTLSSSAASVLRAILGSEGRRPGDAPQMLMGCRKKPSQRLWGRGGSASRRKADPIWTLIVTSWNAGSHETAYSYWWAALGSNRRRPDYKKPRCTILSIARPRRNVRNHL